MDTKFIKILVIDDNPSNLLSIKALINDLFLYAEVFTTTDGMEGIRIAKEEDPTAIFLDIFMPKMNGFEVCQKIKEDEQLSIIPVVFVTALETDREARIKALQVGAEGFLAKPIDELELVAKVKSMVKIKNANQYHRAEKERLNILVQERTQELEIELEKRRKAENTLLGLNIQLQQNQTAMLNLMDDMQNEIENRKRLESELESSLKNEKRQTFELELLLEGAKSILQDREFNLTAKKNFDLLKKITGAASGYVVLLNNQNPSKDLAYFKSDNMPFDIKNNIPLNPDSLKSVVLNTNKIIYENDFMHSHLGKSLPKDHVALRNALYSPLIMEGKSVGLICLINKAEDFNENDVRTAEAFSNLTTLALDNWKSREKLADSEELFRSTILQSNDGIVIADSEFRIIEWNIAQTQIFGYTADEMQGKTLWEFQYINLPEELRTEENFLQIKHKWLTIMDESVENKESLLSVIKEIEIQTKHNLRKTIQVSSFAIRLPGKTLYGSFTRDITDQKYTERMKDSFINMVSHELRTPLASIKGSIDLLMQLQETNFTKEQSLILDICKKNTDRLCTFVNHVLDFQKLKNKSIDLNIAKINLRKLLKDVYSLMLVPAKEKNIQLELDIKQNLPKIECDHDSIYRLMINLVSNGISFTEKGSVSISCKYISAIQAVEICVSDTGIGIQQDDIKKLFASFSQITSSNYSRPGSSGLGLAISKEIVERHHGKIWVESKINEGTSFFVVLPLTQG